MDHRFPPIQFLRVMVSLVTVISLFHFELSHNLIPLSELESGLSTHKTERESRIDVVLSVFEQNQAKTLDHVRRWMQESNLHSLRPRFFVYNKNIEQQSDQFARDTLASMGLDESMIFQETLPNFGREGHTYLHHITRHYDNYENDLADHTVFCQPHMSDDAIDVSINRMNNYYLNSTGFLALDLVVRCDCSGKSCFIQAPHLSSFFPLFQDTMCLGRWSSALRGCFLVSRDRIKRNSLKKYQYIKDLMSTPADHLINVVGDWKRQPANTIYVSYSNPYFGHSLERAWSIIFNCSTFTLDKPVCFD